MLISDCSSDVCSSDRTAIGLHREHQAAAHGIAVDDDRACAADAVLATDMHAGAAGIAAQEVAERQAAFDGRIVLSAVDDEVDWVLAHTAAFITMRSEEHTSELQSLMRISYAVFCLKKKKTNNSHTIHCRTNQA